MKFRSGQSGNPGGRPKGVIEVTTLARQHTAEAINTLAEIMKSGESEAARVFAANAILDRGWGKPSQNVVSDPEADDLNHEDDAAVLVALARKAALAGLGEPAGVAVPDGRVLKHCVHSLLRGEPQRRGAV